jgi:N-acetylmuramoyl-L-alanine amidase
MKRIISLIVVLCLCSACSFSHNETEDTTNKNEQTTTQNETNEKKEVTEEKEDVPEEKEETKTNGYVICINPGHQAKANTNKEKQSPSSSQTKMKVTGGTSGIASKQSESQVVLDVGLKLKEELIDRGYSVVMTRESQDVDISNQQRAIIGNEAHANLTISLHLNGIDDHSVTGAFTICGKNSGDTKDIYSQSQKAAQSIIDCYCKETGIKNKGISYRSDLTGLNFSTVPAIYIEMGHMTNKEEDLKLVDSDFQEKMAIGLANGIDEYLNNN